MMDYRKNRDNVESCLTLELIRSIKQAYLTRILQFFLRRKKFFFVGLQFDSFLIRKTISLSFLSLSSK